MTPLRRRILVRLVPVAGVLTAVMAVIQWSGTVGWSQALGIGVVAGLITAAATAVIFWYMEGRRKDKTEDDE